MAISTTTRTIEVVIKKVKNHHGEVWSVEPKDDEANKVRVKEHRKKIEGKWKDRHGKLLDLDHHRPIVFLEGETLEFTCPEGLRFAIGAKKNSDVDDFPGAPDNPFGWSGLISGASDRPVSAVVIPTTADGPGPKYQAFYKFHGWVRLADGTFEPADPDGYCGG
jgi:hypothetical protein